MEYKPASLLVVSLGKALNEMPPPSSGRQLMGSCSLTEDLQTEPERARSVCTFTFIMLRANTSNDEAAILITY